MTTELFYLMLTALLTGFLWVPAVIGQANTRGLLTPQDYVTAPTSLLPDWANRANRAHLNAVETFAPFAAIVLIAHVTGVHSGVTVAAASAYFFIRVLHAVVHISGFSKMMARTLIFSAGWICMLAIAVEVFRLA